MASDKLEKQYKSVFGRIIAHASPNFSSRFGKPIRASVVHTTESPDDSFAAMISYLSRRGVEASAHYIVDCLERGTTGFTKIARLVPETLSAWTALSANRTTVNYEQIGRASRTRQQWLTKYRAQVRTLALLIADDILDYKLPNRHAYPGYLGHADLSKYGFPQTHHDPGSGFPWDTLHSDISHFLAAGKTQVKKKIEEHTVEKKAVPKAKRPASVPKSIPTWAWQLREWHLGIRKARPKSAPEDVPVWYWQWRLWFDKVNGIHKDA